MPWLALAVVLDEYRQHYTLCIVPGLSHLTRTYKKKLKNNLDGNGRYLLVSCLLEPVCVISKFHISVLNETAGNLLPEGDRHRITKVSSTVTVIH